MYGDQTRKHQIRMLSPFSGGLQCAVKGWHLKFPEIVLAPIIGGFPAADRP